MIKYYIIEFKELGIIEDIIMSRIFNEEKLKEMQDELEFTLLCIGRFVQDRNYIVSRNGSDLSFRVLEDLKAEKLKLEIKIDTLTNYMEGE